jgi:hypothetical protein
MPQEAQLSSEPKPIDRAPLCPDEKSHRMRQHPSMSVSDLAAESVHKPLPLNAILQQDIESSFARSRRASQIHPQTTVCERRQAIH